MKTIDCRYLLSALPLLSAMALGAAGCGASDSGGNSPTGQPPTTQPPTTDPPAGDPPTTPPTTPPTMPPTTPPTTPPEWTTLISGDWSLPAGTEGYTCVRKTIEEDIYAVGFDAINPLGTHHTLLTMGAPNAADGITQCNAGANRTQSIFGSGVGTDALDFPKGVALKIPKGTQILLNLHLFNTGTGVLTGTSGTRIRVVQASDVQQVAEGLLAGPIRLNLPAQQTTKTTGYCTMNMDATLFAVSQHMHMLGVYEKAVVEHAGGAEEVLVDAPYNFDEQKYRAIPPIEVKKGDRVRVECTHNNTTASTVTFGESTLSEMCFAGLYRFPADGSNFMCIN